MPQLQCAAQSYAWGKRGHDSLVAQLKASADPSFTVDANSAYAELWMGTHPNGPSRILRDNKPAELLSEWLATNPNALGAASSGSSASTTTPTSDLPFLFKVLSVHKALSIQAHPDAALARKLHATKPDLYKDPNHKPEMTIALTHFEALSQFRHLNEIVEFLTKVPELRALIDATVTTQFIASPSTESLRQLFKSFIYADAAVVAAQLTALITRLSQSEDAAGSLTPVEALVLRLEREYPNDIGCFCPFLLNYITLAPGDAVFLGANEPHAYLSGDCIECMACSDNVVRAGLTPKYMDRDTLYAMLTYSTGPPTVFRGESVDATTRLYTPPVSEFQVEAIEMTSDTSSYTLRPLAAASVLLVTSGSCVLVENDSVATNKEAAVVLEQGAVFFVAAHQHVTLQRSDTKQRVAAFRASLNERMLLQ